MKVARIENNVVVEIIPTYALPVEKWYGTQFAALCKEVPDNVEPNYIYDPKTDSYQPPVIEDPPAPDPTLDERVTTLESDNNLLKQQLKAASDQNEFLEDCIAEMAEIVYA